jgi:hypothetical protein
MARAGVWQCKPLRASTHAEWVVKRRTADYVHAVISPGIQSTGREYGAALFARTLFVLACYRDYSGNKIDRRYRSNSPCPLAGRPAGDCRRRHCGRPADLARPAGRLTLVRADRRDGASSHCARMAAGDPGQPPRPVAPGRPAGPEGTAPSRPEAITKAPADGIAAIAAPYCMITETQTSQAGRPSCPRRFVVIYRRRQREGHGGRGRILIEVMIFPVSQTLRRSHRAAAWR